MKNAKQIALLILAVLLSLTLTACAQSGSADLGNLVTMMTGSFSSQAQAEADTNFFDIRLEMKSIWTDRVTADDGHYLYVEQAAGWALDKPYRQRVYHVTVSDDGVFSSMVYALPDPDATIGAWKLDKPLAELSPEDLIEREGCAVFLRLQPDGSYKGSTRDKECTSTLRGAVYATSEITIAADQVISWDRGWDNEEKQVWGAEISGYVFQKVLTPAAD